MDEIDQALIRGWARVMEKVLADPGELGRRLRRRARSGWGWMPRESCVCLRASDTRIVSGKRALFDREAARLGEGHGVTLGGEDIRELVAPVSIDYPGMYMEDVAARLGMTTSSLRLWLRRGVFRLYDPGYRTKEYRKLRKPILYTLSPLDPNAELGRPPGEPWGTVWQRHHEKIPERFGCELRRVARFRTLRGREVRRGWSWVCPGLEGKACGRSANRLYLPVTDWTFEGLLDWTVTHLPSSGAVLEPLRESLRDPWIGKRSFACMGCWRLRWTDHVNPRAGWNVLVRHATRGMLMGYEATMPRSFREKGLRRYRSSVRNAEAWGRQMRVLERALTGLSARRISRELGVVYTTVRYDLDRLYRRYGVHSRGELASALGRGSPRRARRGEGKAGRVARLRAG